MRTRSALGTLGVLLTCSAGGAEAAGWRDHVTLLASLRSRVEVVDWFRPKEGASADGAERYDFFGNQLRLGVRATSPHAELTLEVQDTRILGLPDDASIASPTGNLGPGAIYYAHTPETDQGETFLKRASLKLAWNDASATVGRFDHADGLESIPGDPALAWLKRSRVAERLVGPFGYTHVTRAFDGVRLEVDRPSWNASAIGARPTAGGFEISAGEEMDEIGIAGIALTAKRLPGPTSDARFFYLYYDDARGEDGRPVMVDNRALAERSADRGEIRIHTIGGHAIGVADAAGGRFDGLLWGAVQSGDWGALNHDAWSGAVEAGYQRASWPWAPWLRAGFNTGSGDGDAGDGEHQTYFQTLPTARIYAQLPFFNGMNIADAFAQLILKPSSRVTIRTDLHDLRLRSASDLWYAGGGATSEDVFGFSGIPSSGSDDLAGLADLSVAFAAARWLTLQGYYGHAFGGDVVRGTFAGDRADYGFLEATLRR